MNIVGEVDIVDSGSLEMLLLWFMFGEEVVDEFPNICFCELTRRQLGNHKSIVTRSVM